MTDITGTGAEHAAPPKLFVRKSSGLVRAVSGFDAFVYNLLWLNIGLGIGVTFILAPFLYPGSQILLGIAIATVFSAVHVSVWALLSGAMPRSGGDYVFLSRLTHPIIGFVNNWTFTLLNTFVIVLAAYLFVNDGLSPSFAIFGDVGHSGQLLAWSTDVLREWPSFLVGSGAILGLTLAMILFGPKYFAIQRWLFVIGAVGIAVAAVLLAANDHTSFLRHLNAHYGANAAQRTIAAAKKAGIPAAQSGLTPLLGAVAIACFTLPWAFSSAWIGGEVRRPAKTQLTAMVGSVLIGGAVIIVLGWLLLRAVGQDLLSASGYLFYTNGHGPITAPPYYQLFPSILTGNRLLEAIIAVGFTTWTFLWIPINLLSGSRNIFAWSFDRVIPPQFARVNERTRSPVLGLLSVGLLAEVLWAAYSFTGSYFLTSVIAPSLFTIMVLDVGVIYGAYRRPHLLEGAPQAMRRILGIPVIVILAAITVVFFGIMFVFMMTNDTFGANTNTALFTWGGFVVSGFVLWLCSRYYHLRANDYDLSGLYQELPPE